MLNRLTCIQNVNIPWCFCVLKDDFLPYASDPWAYWTGFYTSRPAQKYYIRKSSNFLQVRFITHAIN